MSDSRHIDAVVVGAGLAGLYQLYRLRQLGLTTRVIEAGDGVGGTWYWNRYPGARCDVESLSYSYSFSPELEQEWNWSEKYAAQSELLSYIEHVADRFDLRPDITFGTRVRSAIYDEDARRWRVDTDTGEVIECQFLIMATGNLSVPKAVDLSGLERFSGRTYHTAHWPHEGADFSGQRVAVIGTGSSGIQSIPIIAETAAKLTVFQRTPAFSIPAGNRQLTEAECSAMKAKYPDWREAQRSSSFGVPIEEPTASALDVSAEERGARYQAGWATGTSVGLMGAYTDLITDREANETAAEFVRGRIRETVVDPEVAEALSPRSFAIGTKRLCLDSDYYETFNHENVHLVDVRRTPLVEVTETGLRTSEQTYEFDSIVLATGFDAMTGALLAIDIRGKDGVLLKEKWAEGPRTYLGIAIAGFPNLFTVTGPLSPSVKSNMVVSIEQHVDWISACIAYLRDRDILAIEATSEAENEWVEHVAERANRTLYPTADSWYMGANVPGKPRVFMTYVDGVGLYRQKCDDVALKDYDGFALSPDRIHLAHATRHDTVQSASSQSTPIRTITGDLG